jgi:hypothetical protein
MKLLHATVGRFQAWRHARYLKKKGWTQRQFDLINDPDFCARGGSIRKDVYRGYPYLIPFEDTVPLERRHGQGWITVVDNMTAWCAENATSKWREDILPVNKSWDGEWTQGCMGLSHNILFFAFNNEQDAVMFSLYWSV